MPMNPRLLRPLARQAATPPEPPADPFATLVSNLDWGDMSGTVQSTTGYAKVEWWDGTTDVYGTGAAGDNIPWSKAANADGSKTLRIYPSDASGNLSGSLTYLDCSEKSLTSLDVSGLTALVTLNCGYNSLTSLNVSGCTALTYLTCYINSLTSLNVSGLTALTYLACSENSLTSLNVSGCTALVNLNCSTNSLNSLNASGLTALESLNCDYNFLTSLNVSGCTALTRLRCDNNSLTSLRAQNVGFSGGFYYFSSSASGGAIVNNNQLGGAALDQFYTDLAPGSSPLLVFNNPGTAGDDPSIATAKGYTVYGS